MVLKELVQEIIDIVQDSSLKEPSVQGLVNEAILRVATDLSVPLPDLETSETVETIADQAYLAMPVGFNRDLFFCHNDTIERRVKIHDSLELLAVKYPTMDEAGSVVDVARRGRRLYYQGIPDSVQTLRLHYFMSPSRLTDVTGANDPSWIPEQFHRRLLIAYPCKTLFARIEDGVEGRKVNTDFYEAEWQKGLIDLAYFLGPRARDPVKIHDVFGDLYDE